MKRFKNTEGGVHLHPSVLKQLTVCGFMVRHGCSGFKKKNVSSNNGSVFMLNVSHEKIHVLCVLCYYQSLQNLNLYAKIITFAA